MWTAPDKGGLLPGLPRGNLLASLTIVPERELCSTRYWSEARLV